MENCRRNFLSGRMEWETVSDSLTYRMNVLNQPTDRLRRPSCVANELFTNSNLSFKGFDYGNTDSNTELVLPM